MKVIVVGCGRLGAQLAYRLYQQNHMVSVIDISGASFNNLPADFQGLLCEGDALNQDVLRRAGIQNADAVAVVTNSDALNLVVGHVARKIFQVPNVIARNYEPTERVLYEVFGVQMISPSSWGAQRIEELIYHTDVRMVYSAGNGEVEIYEVIVPEKWNNRTLSALLNPQSSCTVVAVTRAGRAFLPNRDTVLETGDILYLSATMAGIDGVRDQLCVNPKEA